MSKFTQSRPKAFWTIFLVLVFCLTVVLAAGSAGAEPAVVPLLWLNPTDPVITIGTTVDVDMQLDDILDVYGVELNLSFDPAILQVTGGSLTPATCPQPDFVSADSGADNTAGTIKYAATQLNPTPACDGGVVASINFECIAEGESPVTFGSTIISNRNGLPIVHNVQNGTVECQEAVIDIIGTVALQGWPDPTGVAVTLYDTVGIADGPVIVGSDGAFTLKATDESETYRVVAQYDRYLDAEASGISGTGGYVIDLGLVTLRAGDIDGNGVIDILDLSALGGNFGKSSPQGWLP